jgi:hypothetical protein
MNEVWPSGTARLALVILSIAPKKWTTPEIGHLGQAQIDRNRQLFINLRESDRMMYGVAQW